MKPYQGILALIGYLVLQILVARFISVEYYEPIAGVIALIVLGWLLHKKRMLHLSSRDLKGSQLLFCVGTGLGLALISKIAIVLGVLSQEPVPEQMPLTLFFWTQYMATRIVLIPIMEELLFRGILFGSFVSSFSYKIAMVLSAAIFSAVTFDDFLAVCVPHRDLAGLDLLADRQSCSHHGDSCHNQFGHFLVDAALRSVDRPPNHRGDRMPVRCVSGNRDHLSVHQKVPPKTRRLAGLTS